MPDNYGAGKPPPFHPPPSTGSSYYPSENKSYNGLVGPDGVVSPDKMTEREFEEAKARGTIPTWAVSLTLFTSTCFITSIIEIRRRCFGFRSCSMGCT